MALRRIRWRCIHQQFVLTDVETGWTECMALLYKDAESVIKAFIEARQRFPFEIRGLDTDNGPEFITYKLYEYCLNERITFTRSSGLPPL